MMSTVSSQNQDEFVDQRSDQKVIEEFSSLQPLAKIKEQDQRTSSFYSSANKKWSWKHLNHNDLQCKHFKGLKGVVLIRYWDKIFYKLSNFDSKPMIPYYIAGGETQPPNAGNIYILL